jgi:hypothetical protein
MMLRDSLEALVEICKHPIFGPRVRKIQLLNNFFDPITLEHLAADMVGACITTDTARISSGRRRVQRFASLLAEQYDLIQSGAGPELLRTAFEILGAQGRSVTATSQKLELPYAPIGWLNQARNFRAEHIHRMFGDPRIRSTTKILLEAAQAGSCKVSKLQVAIGWFSPDFGDPSHHDFHGSLLLDLQEFSFQFGWRNPSDPYNPLAHQHLVSFLEALPSDLKTLALSSDANVLDASDEPYAVSYSLFEELRHDALATMRPNAFEDVHLSKLFLDQNNLLRFLDAHRGSLKKLVLNEVYLHGDWDQVLSRVAEDFSLEQFTLDRALRVNDDRRNPHSLYSVRIVPEYSEGCELKGEDEMRKNLNTFIDLQRTERHAKMPRKRVQARRPPREAGSQPRRSERIARRSTSED